MPMTPAEIRHTELKRGLLGYRRRTVDQLVREAVESFEEVWRERADLGEQVEELEDELKRHRELEALLRTTLVSAEKAAETLKDQARRESELVLSEAHAEARSITRAALAERERLLGDCHRIRTVLRSALSTVDSVPEPEPAEAEAAAEPAAAAA
jgi:cell division initiation protein